jgi:hypothetical protein
MATKRSTSTEVSEEAMPPQEREEDEFRGQGGSYIIENGKRRLIERTIGPDDPRHPNHPDHVKE